MLALRAAAAACAVRIQYMCRHSFSLVPASSSREAKATALGLGLERARAAITARVAAPSSRVVSHVATARALSTTLARRSLPALRDDREWGRSSTPGSAKGDQPPEDPAERIALARPSVNRHRIADGASTASFRRPAERLTLMGTEEAASGSLRTRPGAYKEHRRRARGAWLSVAACGRAQCPTTPPPPPAELSVQLHMAGGRRVAAGDRQAGHLTDQPSRKRRQQQASKSSSSVHAQKAGASLIVARYEANRFQAAASRTLSSVPALSRTSRLAAVLPSTGRPGLIASHRSHLIWSISSGASGVGLGGATRAMILPEASECAPA
ncbi:uncharacterized protein PSFLO_03675 [Pseudozyma flocculosa]|uniref:Uncharacterized protein n=1 Tax=Pseudozyma flocculosa TaxID=84751 RepID=A0A5C3F196_9BASI|nr:uncharacterized protein PSFLO_03675 [Pseudozyma flocculosa]